MALSSGFADSTLDRSVCVVATGGYARKMLCPHSDVDLMLVTAELGPEQLGEVTSGLLYPLWDAGLDVGHRQGSIEELVAAAENDETARTAMLDLRLVAGSRALFDELSHSVDEAWARWSADFGPALRRESLIRFRRYGESVFLLEPQVKEGKGGLRDFHWLLWTSRVVAGARGDYDLLLDGLVEPEHYEALIDAYEFLLRVRVQLHLHTGRPEDRLLFDYQEPVARALGFKASGGLMAVERFMGAYYAHAYALAHTCGLYVARMMGFYWDEPEVSVGQSEAPLLLGPSAPQRRREEDEAVPSPCGLFVLESGSVRCLEPTTLREHPLKILKLFSFIQQTGGRLHHDTTEQIRSALGRVGVRFRKSPEAATLFRRILEGPEVFRTLVAMHRSGFLGRYIPEFGACFCQAQHNRVHLYTVDVHCLYVVRELESLGREPDGDLFGEAWRGREEKGPLLLAGLLHDIAKSHGSAHSRVGAEMARSILHRLGYAEDDVALVEWLVLHHLLLSDVAYHRDLLDPGTLASLRAVVPGPTHLNSLLALTWADTRATNPSLATSWKRALLEQTWRATMRALDPEDGEALAPLQVRDTVRAQLEAILGAELPRREATSLIDRFLDPRLIPTDYLERHSIDELAVHAILLHRLDTPGAQDFACHHRALESAGVTRWTVCTTDRVGLFGLLAGALSACGLNIISAETTTRRDGTCVDSFSVVDSQGKPVPEDGRWRRVERLLERVLGGESSLEGMLSHLRGSPPVVPRSGSSDTRVEVRNDLSQRATVVEVVTSDRPGLVYDITQLLCDFNLDLRLAKIATRHDLASDTFYVVGRGGRQVGKRRCRQLARLLEEHFA